MKQAQALVFLIKPEEISSLAQGQPLLIKPTTGTPFLLMLDPPIMPVMNGQPPAAIQESDKGYIVHRRAPGKGKGRFECKCGVTADTLSRLFKHQKKAHAKS